MTARTYAKSREIEDNGEQYTVDRSSVGDREGSIVGDSDVATEVIKNIYNKMTTNFCMMVESVRTVR